MNTAAQAGKPIYGNITIQSSLATTADITSNVPKYERYIKGKIKT